MILLIAGLGVLLITGLIFWMCLPRGGKLYRFANTEWEPYIGVAFTAAVALGFTMVLSSVLDLLG
jgi:hypothetical protein